MYGKIVNYNYLSLAEVSPIKKRVRLIIHVNNQEFNFFERKEEKGKWREWRKRGREEKGIEISDFGWSGGRSAFYKTSPSHYWLMWFAFSLGF
jgi:hypothetical protein